MLEPLQSLGTLENNQRTPYIDYYYDSVFWIQDVASLEINLKRTTYKCVNMVTLQGIKLSCHPPIFIVCIQFNLCIQFNFFA